MNRGYSKMKEIIMPQMGESVVEGTIIKWYVKEGDGVGKDQPLVEISTDKVDTEVPSPVRGVVKQILHNVDETVPVGTVIAIMEESKGETESPPPVVISDKKNEELIEERVHNGTESRKIYSPLVRRLAIEYGVDLEKIKGSGAGGRISKEDILDYVKGFRKVAASAKTEFIEVLKPEEREVLIPVSNKRKIIAERMVKSTTDIPHVTSTFEVDMTAIAIYKDSVRDAFLKEHGVRLTFLPFIVSAVTSGLKEYPILNSSWSDNGIVLKRYINIGIAVSIEDGLIVPVIKGADQKGLIEIARDSQDLAKRAREKKLSVEEVQEGTFTITNYGVGGSLFGTPIILQPQVAILGIGAITKRPVIINDAIAIREIAYLSISFDHRVIDGSQADQFLSKIKAELEGWRNKNEKVPSAQTGFGGVW